ncbi:MAG TPA: hypothetical protein DDW49_02365 [Deltaproteobacteria bacterium]|nr:MAG: hypothetical protein A2048_02850 [Deltaproteobacteria bacterium GWA2_45_12]HBF12228.1 hypothetical protein [Deltaproteobacteria bacterium]
MKKVFLTGVLLVLGFLSVLLFQQKWAIPNAMADGCTIGIDGTDSCHSNDIGDPPGSALGNLRCVTGSGSCETCLAENIIAEACNNKDDDCNGQADDGDICGANRFCLLGESYCCPVEGTGQGGLNAAGEDRCDGVDNDGDSLVDEAATECFLPPPVPIGEGNFHCVGGSCQTCTTVSAESCNLIDDDCDGQIDEDATCPDGTTCFDGHCCAPTAAAQQNFRVNLQAQNNRGGGGCSLRP